MEARPLNNLLCNVIIQKAMFPRMSETDVTIKFLPEGVVRRYSPEYLLLKTL